MMMPVPDPMVRVKVTVPTPGEVAVMLMVVTPSATAGPDAASAAVEELASSLRALAAAIETNASAMPRLLVRLGCAGVNVTSVAVVAKVTGTLNTGAPVESVTFTDRGMKLVCPALTNCWSPPLRAIETAPVVGGGKIAVIPVGTAGSVTAAGDGRFSATSTRVTLLFCDDIKYKAFPLGEISIERVFCP